jgi:hypothetical protein
VEARLVVASFGYFLVQKVLHQGTLFLYQDCIAFSFESGVSRGGGAFCMMRSRTSLSSRALCVR